jgi:broad specificity phosphatase PhoE
MRHGKVASHRGDLPLTDEGREQVARVGQRFSRDLVPDEIVSILHAPTQRTRETALVLYNGMLAALTKEQREQIDLRTPVEQQAIRNPDIYVAGTRVEMVSSAQALVDQLPPASLSVEAAAQLPFWKSFWESPDRIGYWVSHPSPPGEDTESVARRLLLFAASQLDMVSEQPRRTICVTHSPPMRAFLRCYLLGYDPGEPNYTECVDLDLLDDKTCIIHYRENSKRVTLRDV